MQTLAFVNQKGGCGKTTTAVHLAGALAKCGDQVLLVDMDPQAHATIALGCAVAPGSQEGPAEEDLTIADVLLDGVRPQEVVRFAPGGIALLPSGARLAEFEQAAERVLRSEGYLARALAELDLFDHVLIDCPPRADGVLTANALRAADTAVLVVETGTFALQGAFRALDVLEELADGMHTTFGLRVVSTLFDRRVRLARDLLIGTQARFGPVMFDTVIHESIRLREAAAFGLPVQELDPHCRATRDFDALAQEVRALTRVSRAVSDSRVREPTPSGAAHDTFQGVSETWMG